MWRVFAEAYGQETDNVRLLERIEKFKGLVTQLNTRRCLELISVQTTLESNWLTHLTLSGVECSRTDLLELTQIWNLGILIIFSDNGVSQYSSMDCKGARVDDRIIRAWAFAVLEAGAFRKLHTLACIGQDRLGHQIFEHLTVFPVLTSFLVNRLSFKPLPKQTTLDENWRCVSNKPTWLFEIDDSHAYCEPREQSIASEKSTTKSGGASALPILAVSLQGEWNAPVGPSLACFMREAPPKPSERPPKRTMRPPSQELKRRRAKVSKFTDVRTSFVDMMG